MVDALNTWGAPLPRRSATDPVVRIVLAEAAVAPGPLHYLLEAEGFQILGSASDEDELTRILSQPIEPDVIVLDAEVPAATVMVAHEFAPDAEMIVIWPEGIVPPASADQVFPDLIFEELGPAVRRAVERNRLRRPPEDEPDDIAIVKPIPREDAGAESAAAARTAGRVLVGTVAVIAAIVLTMGASFALQGFRAAHDAGSTRPPGVVASQPTLTQRGSSASQSHANSHASSAPGCDANRRSGPNAHASTKADAHASTCPARAGGQGPGHHQGRGNGSGQGPGAGQGQGAGHGQSGQHGSGDHGGQAPSDHPTGPPESPGPGDHASPRAISGR